MRKILSVMVAFAAIASAGSLAPSRTNAAALEAPTGVRSAVEIFDQKFKFGADCLGPKCPRISPWPQWWAGRAVNPRTYKPYALPPGYHPVKCKDKWFTKGRCYPVY